MLLARPRGDGLLGILPAFFLTAYLPGYLAALALCALHVHEGHARGTRSHHGRLYNLLFWHERAFARLLCAIGPVRTAAIVGGGLFPRTALILKKLLPGARLVVIDASSGNIQAARPLLDGSVEFVHARYDPLAHAGFDLLVIPQTFRGDREAVYGEPGAPAVLVHDWIRRRRGVSAVVWPFLRKRLNLIRP